jgi:hypothetical protein
VIVRATGQKLVMSPPLVIEENDLDKIVEVLARSWHAHGRRHPHERSEGPEAPLPAIQSVERAARMLGCSRSTSHS